MWAKTRECIKSALNVFSFFLLCLISSSELEKKFWPAAKRSPLVSIIESWGCSSRASWETNSLASCGAGTHGWARQQQSSWEKKNSIMVTNGTETWSPNKLTCKTNCFFRTRVFVSWRNRECCTTWTMQIPWRWFGTAAAPSRSWRFAWAARRDTSVERSARTWPAARRTVAFAFPSMPCRWKKSRAAEAKARIDRGAASGKLSSSWCRERRGLSAEGRFENH